MAVKRMRVFAGPNGSGKTTIIRNLNAEIPFGVYVNADDIEQALHLTNSLDFNTFQLQVTEEQVRDFFSATNFSARKRQEEDLPQKLKVEHNILSLNTSPDSYLAAGIADFIRQQLLQAGASFTFETVMSHESKVGLMAQARKMGYRVYLYFIATEDAEININRVGVRVAQRGHPVAPEVVRDRYFKSLQLLKDAVKQSNRAYLFDNSGIAANLFAEITEGVDVVIVDTGHVPNWFIQYLLNDN